MKKKKHSKKSEKNLIQGALSVTKYGYGFVDTELKKGFFVSEKNMGTAMNGDYVCAERIKGKKGGECRITKILERNTFEIAGEYRRYQNQSFLVPVSNSVNQIFKIKHTAPEIPQNINEGDLILGEILSYGEKSKYPTVYVSEYLGDRRKKGNDISVILRGYGINEKFGDDVLHQHIDSKITEEDLANREDFTNLTVVTIDGEDAKDLDDAVNVTKTADGYTLGVHIADVSHYVRSKTPIDKEAYRRGTSVYLPDRVAPMLPEKLSNGVCSLNPNELKLTFSCVMNIDKHGKIVDYRIVKSYIKTKARLTYTLVRDTVLGKNTADTEKYGFLRDDIMLMNELYEVMRKRRRKKGFTEFNFPETKFKLDENGKAIDIFPYETSFANEIIEEFMLAANTSVADFAMKHDLPFIYRTHADPAPEKLEHFYSLLNVLGIKHKDTKKLTPSELNAILKEAEDTPYLRAVMQAGLRTMQKAVYSDVPAGHYGLNFKKYCHFTSPIRRYPDLAIHRILSEYLSGNSVKKYFRTVHDTAQQSTQTEINAFMAERDCDDVKKAEYMSDKIGECFDAYISGMCETGFFAALPNTAEGYVSFESIRGDYYEYFPESFTARGKKRGNIFMLGQNVRVRLKSCNIPEGKIEFTVLQD